MKAVIASGLLAFPAAAQELPFSPTATENCLSNAASRAEREACVGKSAEVCYSAEGVYSNYAIGVCFGVEADYWDGRLNAAYVALIEAETALMDEMRKSGATAVPDAASALHDMQRAWLPYRDAACWYEYSTWGGGSGGGPANAECLMHVTARQALALEAQLEERRQ